MDLPHQTNFREYLRLLDMFQLRDKLYQMKEPMNGTRETLVERIFQKYFVMSADEQMRIFRNWHRRSNDVNRLDAPLRRPRQSQMTQRSISSPDLRAQNRPVPHFSYASRPVSPSRPPPTLHIPPSTPPPAPRANILPPTPPAPRATILRPIINTPHRQRNPTPRPRNPSPPPRNPSPPQPNVDLGEDHELMAPLELELTVHNRFMPSELIRNVIERLHTLSHSVGQREAREISSAASAPPPTTAWSAEADQSDPLRSSAPPSDQSDPPRSSAAPPDQSNPPGSSAHLPDQFVLITPRRRLSFSGSPSSTADAARASRRSISVSGDTSDTRKMECKICFDHEMDCVLLPCGHVCCCYGCGIQLKFGHHPGSSRCPICRNYVDCLTRIFYS